MLIFGIDTCSMSSSVALSDGERMIAQFSINHKKTHSERVMGQISSMLKSADINIEDIDVFAASVGPGSFTGVRIGVATVKALAQVTKKPCVMVSSLEGLSMSLVNFNGIIAPILDARRNQVYNALFKSNSKNLSRLCDDRAISINALLDELKQYNEKIIFTGDGVPVFKDEIISILGDKAFFSAKPLMYNQAAAVAEIGLIKALNGDVIDYKDLVPQYVRLSQAEQEKLRRESEK